MRHLIVCPADFKGKHRLEILSLKNDFNAQRRTQIYGRCQGSLLGNFIYTGSKYQTQVIRRSIWEEKTLGDASEGSRGSLQIK